MKYDWPKLLSNIAIIIGLVLVIYELNQSRDLAMFQIQVDDFIAVQNFHNSLLGENPGAAIVKAKESSQDLSAEEAFVVDNFLDSIMARLESYEFVSLFGGDYESAVLFDLRKHFNSEYARDWWEREKRFEADWRPGITEIVDKFYADNPSFSVN